MLKQIEKMGAHELKRIHYRSVSMLRLTSKSRAYIFPFARGMAVAATLNRVISVLRSVARADILFCFWNLYENYQTPLKYIHAGPVCNCIFGTKPDINVYSSQ